MPAHASPSTSPGAPAAGAPSVDAGDAVAGLPLLAFVGRPNVGKSTLFNRVLGRRSAIVQDLPGTTRDRLYAVTEWRGIPFRVVDTGGLLGEQLAGPYADEVATQVHQALAGKQVKDRALRSIETHLDVPRPERAHQPRQQCYGLRIFHRRQAFTLARWTPAPSAIKALLGNVRTHRDQTTAPTRFPTWGQRS